ncbi:ABC transporter permease [Nostocoides sp. F2B08]|uniref:ABC transporter permease n=1 Tax=Nostocoides sp. F2B08 TaxID=2653936 RepID=UPI001D03E519|nr:ABC transporter permease [Tetrasphaera sp. F2B08]
MSHLLTMTLSDLRQRIRDKSVLLFAFVVPLALMGVFNLIFGTSQDLDLQPVTVAVSTPADDPLASVVPDVLDGLDETDGGVAVTVLELPSDEVSEAVDDGRAALGIEVPAGFGAAVSEGEDVAVTVSEGESSVETAIALSVVDGALARLHAQSVTVGAAAAAGVPPDELEAVAAEVASGGPAFTVVPGEAATQQLSPAAALVAGQTGLFLLFTVSFGVLGLIEERQNGTLARLRSMPMASWLIVAAKALVSFVLGIVATTVLLTVGGAMFDVDFGSPVPVGVIVVSVVLAATSVMFLVVRVARTAEQASVAASIVALVLGIGGGAFTPISASGALGTLLDLNPIAAFMRGLGITSGGGGLTDITVPVMIMLGFAVVMVVLSRVIPDRGVVS